MRQACLFTAYSSVLWSDHPRPPFLFFAHPFWDSAGPNLHAAVVEDALPIDLVVVRGAGEELQ